MRRSQDRGGGGPGAGGAVHTGHLGMRAQCVLGRPCSIPEAWGAGGEGAGKETRRRGAHRKRPHNLEDLGALGTSADSGWEGVASKSS